MTSVCHGRSTSSSYQAAPNGHGKRWLVSCLQQQQLLGRPAGCTEHLFKSVHPLCSRNNLFYACSSWMVPRVHAHCCVACVQRHQQQHQQLGLCSLAQCLNPPCLLLQSADQVALESWQEYEKNRNEWTRRMVSRIGPSPVQQP